MFPPTNKIYILSPEGPFFLLVIGIKSRASGTLDKESIIELYFYS